MFWALVVLIGYLAQAPFVQVGEGFTTDDVHHGIDAGYRRFSTPDAKQMCATAPRPNSFRGPDSSLRLSTNRWFALSRLAVLAQDSDGRVLSPVPITIE